MKIFKQMEAIQAASEFAGDEIEKIFDGPRGRIDDFMAQSEDDQYMDTGAAYELLIDLRDSIDAFHKQFDALFSVINPAQDGDEN